MDTQKSSNVLYNFSYPSNHLLNVIVLENTKRPEFEKYIAIVGLVPGEQVGNTSTNRTYVQAKRIQLKFSLQELLEFSFTLAQCAIGNSKVVLPYTKFSKSNDVSKSVSIIESMEADTRGTQRRSIGVIFSANDAKYGIKLSPSTAYGLASYINEIALNIIRKDINDSINGFVSTKGSDDNVMKDTPFSRQISAPF